tara:strand:+ start:1857 stop:2108 length:252 start_codon:yes stop_codon:yes gene_type:complete
MNTKSKINKMQDEMWQIYNEWGGYDYNDEMLIQLSGVDGDIAEAEYFNEWEYCHENVEATYKWFKQVKKIRQLQESMSDAIYC